MIWWEFLHFCNYLEVSLWDRWRPYSKLPHHPVQATSSSHWCPSSLNGKTNAKVWFKALLRNAPVYSWWKLCVIFSRHIFFIIKKSHTLMASMTCRGDAEAFQGSLKFQHLISFYLVTWKLVPLTLTEGETSDTSKSGHRLPISQRTGIKSEFMTSELSVLLQ